MCQLKVVSFNINGLGDSRKRKEVFYWLRKHTGASIIMLQETHLSAKDEHLWRSDWDGQICFAHGDTNSKGVCILFDKSNEYTLHDIVKDNEEGRYLLLDITIAETRLTLANIYCPNQDDISFFNKIIYEIETLPDDNRIVGGDLNFVLDTSKDKKAVP